MIESVQNLEVKRLLKLRRARIRRSEGLFIVEGQREIQVGLEAGVAFERVFFCRSFLGDREQEGIFPRLRKCGVPLVEMAQAPFKKISLRQNPDGLFALASTWKLSVEDLTLGETPVVLLMDGVEKPGNLGAVLRSAEAFGVDAVVCVDPSLDLFNPNVVRSSQGLFFRVPTLICDRDTITDFLRLKELRIIATSAKAVKSAWEIDYCGGTALVMGSEAHGLDPYWLEVADERIAIPMQGEADSLNLSVATGCLLAEIYRQRTR